MSNLFDEVLSNAKGVEEKLLGPDYDYVNKIKTPDDLGLSDKGDLSTLIKDVDGLLEYTEVLVTGGGASKVGGPLGNKFFLETGQTCKDVDTGQEVSRSIYINNVPNGSIPFITSAYGVKFEEFEGLIPGAIGNTSALNPFAMMQSFLAGGVPDCRSVTMEVVDNNNQRNNETHYVTLVDIANEGFENRCGSNSNSNSNSGCKNKKNKNNKKNKGPTLPDDRIVQFFFFTLSILGVYILYKMMLKHK